MLDCCCWDMHSNTQFINFWQRDLFTGASSRNLFLYGIYRTWEIIDQYYEQKRAIILINASGIVKLDRYIEDTTTESRSSTTSSFARFVMPRADGQVWQVAR